MMTYQNMSAFVAIIVHHCLKNLSDSQAESRSHMCSTSKSIQHRRSSESSCGLRSMRPPLFLKSHENRSPHESPKTSTSGHFWWWLAWYIQCVLSLRCQSRPRMSLAAACNGIEWVCRAECKHTLYEQAHEVTEQSQAHCTLTCRTRRPRCCFPWPQKHVEFISCWQNSQKVRQTAVDSRIFKGILHFTIESAYMNSPDQQLSQYVVISQCSTERSKY